MVIDHSQEIVKVVRPSNRRANTAVAESEFRVVAERDVISLDNIYQVLDQWCQRYDRERPQ